MALLLGADGSGGMNNSKKTDNSYICYGYKVLQDATANNNGAKMITEITNPLYTLSNTGYTPMAMEYDSSTGVGTMNWGSWTGKEFIFPRSCALGYDGIVDYYLDEDDESKREDGNASDYKNLSYNGNMMVEFGRDDSIIFTRYVNNSDDSVDVYLANKNIDGNFHAWPFIGSDGKLKKHFYMAKYFGYSTGGRLRSISGTSGTTSTTRATERSTAEANNPSGKDIWETVTKVQWDLFTDILTLLSMSLDSQTAFGYGRVNASSSVINGTMDGKGMFYGDNKGNLEAGSKVLGVEHPWGNLWRSIAGWNQGSSGITLIKLCKGTADGSISSEYSNDGTGYIAISDDGQACSGYISKMKYDERGFKYPIACSGSETTYYHDYKWTSTNAYAIVGGYWGDGVHCGASYVYLYGAASLSDSTVGSSPSCISEENYE